MSFWRLARTGGRLSGPWPGRLTLRGIICADLDFCANTFYARHRGKSNACGQDVHNTPRGPQSAYLMKNAIKQVSSGKYWIWHRANRRPLEGFRVPPAFEEVVSTSTRILHILDVISSAPLISQDTTTLLPSLFVKRKFDESKESSISWSFPNLSRQSFPSTMTRATVLFHSG